MTEVIQVCGQKFHLEKKTCWQLIHGEECWCIYYEWEMDKLPYSFGSGWIMESLLPHKDYKDFISQGTLNRVSLMIFDKLVKPSPLDMINFWNKVNLK